MSLWDRLDAARGGDQKAWNDLIYSCAPRLIRLAEMITGSPDVAEDIVQETFFELYRKPPRHRKGSLTAWLGTVAYHRALKEKQQQKRVISLPPGELTDPGPPPFSRILQDDLQDRVLQILAALDAAQRDVLILRFFGELSLREIAEELQLPLGTVKSRLFYGAKTCRAALAKKGITP